MNHERTIQIHGTSRHGAETMKIKRGRGVRVGIAGLVPILSVMAMSGCDFDSILEVDIPGKVIEEALDNPALAQTLLRSVVAAVECSWNQYVGGAAIHSDEYLPSSGNGHMRDWGQRKIRDNDAGYSTSLCGDWGFPMYQPLQTARFQAEDVFQRLSSEGFADVPNRDGLRATARAYGAFPLIAMGEGMCETSVPDTEGTPGPLLTRGQVMELAETRLTEALTLAQQVGNDDIANMARVARARVRLNRENFAGAIADASAVPEGYLKVATRDESIAARYNYYFERINATSGFRQHGTISPHYRGLTIDGDGRPTQDDGVPDVRVNAMTTGGLAADFSTIHWFHDKYNSRADPVPMASYREAQLVLAEASARSGDLDTARNAINGLRMARGLPTFDLPATASEMISLVIEERRRELFVEGGHRLNDMLRFRDTEFHIPFLGEPGSIHPDGRDQTGDLYGTTTCFPLPVVERLQNPNIPS